MKSTPTNMLFWLFIVFLLLTKPLQAADYINFIGMKFKNIPAGSFYMGSCIAGSACPSGASVDTSATDDETPQHKVTISKSFQIGIHEVTLEQFEKFIAVTGHKSLLTDEFLKYNSHGDNAAVCWVSWNDTQLFIAWLNKKEGNHYRLPTEAEWEYTARAGTTTKYSWGKKKSHTKHFAWYRKNAYDVGNKYSHPVGRKRPNPWGLYDMHGNVWEWVQDWYDDYYYNDSPNKDPKGPTSGRGRVSRGGSWNLYTTFQRSAIRVSGSPDSHGDNIGFRLLREP